VAAKVFTIGGFSAHADQKGLMEWAGHFASAHPHVFVTHGEATASQALAAKLREELKLDASVPRLGERLILEPQKMSSTVPVEAVPEDLEQVMQGTVINLERELEDLKKRLATRGGRVQESDIDRLREIEEDLRMILPG